VPLPEALLDEPLPEALLDEPSRAAPLGGPSRAVVPPVGLLARPRRPGRGLFPVEHTNRCLPQSRRHQEKTLQGEHRAEA
jgi:hypothetical protein